MSLEHRVVQEAALQLAKAARLKLPIPPLSKTYEGLDPDDAYAIQLENVNACIASGGRIIGHKIGLTAKVMQEVLGVNEPDYGVLFASMVYEDGAKVAAETLLQPRVEVETAFTLARKLRGPGVTTEAVLAATAFVSPSIEIIDSRIEDWRITLVDTIADNASSAGVVLGAGRPLEGLALEAVEAKLLLNGESVAEGRGADVLEHPAAAVAWLANKLASFGIELAAREVIMPGSCTKAVDIRAGDVVRAELSELGAVQFSLTAASA